LCVPSEGLVYGEHNDHVYPWAVARGSFLAASNPEVVEAMEAVAKDAVSKAVDARHPLAAVSQEVRHTAAGHTEYEDSVYPFVKSMFPAPGSIVPLRVDGSLVGVITSSTVEFMGADGQPTPVDIYSSPTTSLDLTQDGRTLPSVLVSFAQAFLPIDKSLFSSQAASSYLFAHTPTIVFGDPTPGFDSLAPTYAAAEVVEKSVVVEEGGRLRLQVRFNDH
jgi:hypothetical protein